MKIMEKIRSHAQIFRYVGFAASMLGMMVAGSVYSINAYSEAIKVQLRLSQSQVELLVSFGVIATCIGITAGLFMERFGPQVTAGVAGVIGFAGPFLMAMAIEGRVSQSFAGVCGFIFITGQGSIFFYMLALMSTATNFPLRVRGTMFGVMDAMYGGSASIWSAMYGELFGSDDDPMRQNPAGYLYTVAAISAAVGLLMLVAVHHLPCEEEEEPSAVAGQLRSAVAGVGGGGSSDHDSAAGSAWERSSVVNDTDDDTALLSSGEGSAKQSDAATEDKTLKELVRDLDFHLLFWPFIIVSSLTTMYIANVTFYFKAFHLENEYRRLVTILIPGLGLVFRLCLGFSSDKAIKWIPRSFFICGTTAMLVVSLVLLRVHADKAWVLLLNSVTMPLAASATWSLVPTIVTELSGVKHFGQVWGVVMIFSGLAALVFQLIYGKVYDVHVIGGTTTCYGAPCFNTTTDVLLACCVLSLTMLIILAVRQWRKRYS